VLYYDPKAGQYWDPTTDFYVSNEDVARLIFNFFMNAGPNATTYALPAEIFPSDIRAAGHGFAAGAAKLGAALGVFFFPILQDAIGIPALVFGMAGICILALVVTQVFKIEPAGKSLDEISGRKLSGLKARPTPP
jgi:MFS family permease